MSSIAYSDRPDIKGGRNSMEEGAVVDYLMEWYEDTPDEFEIDWSTVTVIVSARLSRSHGKARALGDGTHELKISRPAYRDKDWKETARHEAIHIFQYQVHDSGGHGFVFKKWADRFNCTQYADSPAKKPKYTIHCPDCGQIGSKARACKTTKHIERYQCQKCGHERLSVYKHR